MRLDLFTLEQSQDWIRSYQFGVVPAIHDIPDPHSIAQVVENSLQRLLQLGARVSHLPSGLAMLSADIGNHFGEVESAAPAARRTGPPSRAVHGSDSTG